MQKEQRPVLILRIRHSGPQDRILKSDNFALGDGKYRMTTNRTDFPSLSNEQHVVWTKKLDKT